MILVCVKKKWKGSRQHSRQRGCINIMIWIWQKKAEEDNQKQFQKHKHQQSKNKQEKNGKKNNWVDILSEKQAKSQKRKFDMAEKGKPLTWLRKGSLWHGWEREAFDMAEKGKPLTWLRKGSLKRETKCLLIRLPNNVMRTN